jgi:hypothetical protein
MRFAKRNAVVEKPLRGGPKPGLVMVWAAALMSLILVTEARAVIFVPGLHVVDGTFSSAAEWDITRPSVSVLSFTVDGIQNGAYLYVEQTNNGNPVPLNSGLGNRLELMYDFVSSPTALPGSNPTNSFFDVFFQVPTTQTDYAVRIGPGGFQAFEKPTGTLSGQNPDGSLQLTDGQGNPLSPWQRLDAGDLQTAQFQTALGFGTSPNGATGHLMAEFELSINNGSNDGLYSPDPSFWGAGGASGPGARGGLADPPISSGIFTLNPDGTTTVVPALGLNGGPVLQPQQVVPEPASVLLLAAGLGTVGLVQTLRRRARGSVRS